jgi:hypothetical protein
MRFFLAGILSFFILANLEAGGTPLQRDIDLVVKQGRGTPQGRAAWERLSLAKADALPAILDAMNTKDTVASNWLRTAFDRIIDRESKHIDTASILVFVRDPAKHGRARRFGLDLVEQLQPGTRAKLLVDWLDDPEFRLEAVALVLQHAKSASDPDLAVKLYRQAFDKSRDIQQARDAAAGLELGGVHVGVGAHLGFLMDWHLIGPFDGKGQQGLREIYPPEKRVNLEEELVGQKGKVRWIRYQVREPAHKSSGRHQALVDLRDKQALGNADDAVGFAYTEFYIDQATKAEMRGAADDNLTVYVNGVKAFSFEEWRNGVRHDRHRFSVALNAGKNTVLVKVSQSAAPNPEPNWEFFLRVVDATGKGIPMKTSAK